MVKNETEDLIRQIEKAYSAWLRLRVQVDPQGMNSFNLKKKLNWLVSQTAEIKQRPDND